MIEAPSTAFPELPEGALLQVQTANREGDLSGYRVYLDGRAERRKAGGDRVERPALAADAVARIVAALDASGLERVAGHHRAPSSPDDAPWRFLQARVNGRPVALRIDGGCEVAEERALNEQIADVLP
ncbi:MAG: hypothetical protein D6798_19205 [Deltaproteobacteria bacterium]|nr:MAG: hypothetical protein D6798_19205 [Deltaproteobacteria bacterium]